MAPTEANQPSLTARNPTKTILRPHRVELQQLLGDLHGVGRRALAEVVADAPEEQGVGAVEVLANPADEDLVAVRGGGGQGIGAFAGSSTTTRPGAFAQTARAASGVIGRSVSIRIDSLWLYRTGTRTHVGQTSIESSPMILRVSFTIFISSFV